jgi:tRNA (guanine-N7-)-methyltransferase
MSDTPPDSLFHRPASYVERLDYGAMFPRPQPLEVELGCGAGSFLLAYTAQHPTRNFLGIERLSGRIGKLDRKGRRAGLTNLRLMRVEAAYFVQYLLVPNSVAAVHVYFPDPWPKKRHHKNRLIQPPFVDVLGHALAPGGTVYLRTDDQEYFAQMVEVFGGATQFEPVETPAELKAVVTDFEREFNARGIPTNYAAYRLREK